MFVRTNLNTNHFREKLFSFFNSRKVILLLFPIFVLACKEKNEIKLTAKTKSSNSVISIPKVLALNSDLKLLKESSTWTFEGKPYSGYAMSYYENDVVKEKSNFYEGRKEGVSKMWYQNGNLKQISTYKRGKLDGEKKAWASDINNTLMSHLNYQNGKPHGRQKTWYTTGELHKVLNLNMGREEGIQQAYRKNGVLYANYEARNGRIFGLKKASLCFGLEDEKMGFQK